MLSVTWLPPQTPKNIFRSENKRSLHYIRKIKDAGEREWLKYQRLEEIER